MVLLLRMGFAAQRRIDTGGGESGGGMRWWLLGAGGINNNDRWSVRGGAVVGDHNIASSEGSAVASAAADVVQRQ